MGVQELQAIQNAWNNAIESVYRRRQLEQSAAYQQQEIQQRQQEADLRTKEFEAQQAQQEVLNKSNAAVLAMQKAQFAQQAAQNYQSTGIVPPGTRISPSAPINMQTPGTPETSLPAMPQTPGTVGTPGILPNIPATPPSVKSYNQVKLTLPPELGGGTMTALTPEDSAKLAADRARQLEAPKTEAEFLKLAQEHAFRVQEINEQKKWDDERTRMTISAENARAANQQANELRIHMLDTTGGLSEMMRGQPGGGGLSITVGPDGAPQYNLPKAAQNLQNGSNNIFNGNMTIKEFESANPKQKQAMASLLGMGNVVSLEPDDKKELQDAQIMKSFADRLYELHQIRQQGVTAKWQEFNSKEAQLQKDLPGIISRLNNVKRANTVELENEMKGLFPSRTPAFVPFYGSNADAEGMKYNDFVQRNILQRAKDVVRNTGATSAQQDAILHNYGMDQLKRLKLTSDPPTTPPPSKTIIYTRDPKTGQLIIANPGGGQ